MKYRGIEIETRYNSFSGKWGAVYTLPGEDETIISAFADDERGAIQYAKGQIAKALDHSYCPRCGYELEDPDTHYRDPGSKALYCLLGTVTPYDRYDKVSRAILAEARAGDISPVIANIRLASAARAYLAETGQREAMS